MSYTHIEFNPEFQRYLEINSYMSKEKDKIAQVRVRGFEPVSYAPSNVVMPTRKTKGSACYDFYLPCNVTVPAHGMSNKVELGIKAYMPEDEVLLLHIRSSVGINKGVILANGTGIIDSDYYNCEDGEGNIGIRLVNMTSQERTFNAGDRICQGMFVKYGVADNDYTTEERKGGIGSSGK